MLFYLINTGVSKSGTSDLYNRIILHPDVYASQNKGPHFWDECPFPISKCAIPPDYDFLSYINLFNSAASKIKNNTV